MPTFTKTECPDCRHETNHAILYLTRGAMLIEDPKKISHHKHFEEYLVVQCQGCLTVSFVLRYRGKNFIDAETGKKYVDINFPDWDDDEMVGFLTFKEVRKLPRQLSKLYEEVQITFEENANMLAGVGLRMLIEAICLEQNMVGSNLKTKIDKLHDAGLISRNEMPILHTLREMGNTSAHEIKSFSLFKLKYALEIINHVLKSIYILPGIQKKLTDRSRKAIYE